MKIYFSEIVFLIRVSHFPPEHQQPGIQQYQPAPAQQPQYNAAPPRPAPRITPRAMASKKGQTNFSNIIIMQNDIFPGCDPAA
jgi:hypothetical protein